MRRYVMVLVTVLLLVPSTASALVTAVTEPATGTRFFVDSASLPTIHIAGTSDAVTGQVDLKCVSGQGGQVGIGTTPLGVANVNGDGTWATDVQWPSNGSGLCEIFAVAHNTTPTTNADLAGLTGSKVYPGFLDLSTYNGKLYDYYASMNAPGAYFDFDSFGDCTMDYGQLAQLHEYDASIFDCNGYVESVDHTATSSQPSITVDNRPAYPTYYIGTDGGLRDLTGWDGLTVNLADDGGSWHLTSHEGIFRCANNDAFPTSGCTGLVSTGLGLDVDERQSPDGRTVTQDLRFVNSTDQQHTLSVVLNQTVADVRQWFFPGTAGFQDYGLNDTPSVIAPAVATIRNQIDPPTPETLVKGVGAITYASAPTAEQFWSAGNYFAQKYTNVTIPPGRAARIHLIYTINDTAAHLDTQIAAAEASIGAPPAITVSSATTATAAAYSLTGTINAPEGVNGLTINDQPATVAGDGTFSVPETLAAGANAFTLEATDELGRTSASPFSVTLSTTAPPPANNPLAVVFGKKGKVRLKGRTLTTALTASCPGAGPDCSITAVATSGRKKVGSGKATVKANATAGLKIKLSKAGAKLLKRKHKLSLKLSGKRTGASTTNAKRTVTLKAKKKR